MMKLIWIVGVVMLQTPPPPATSTSAFQWTQPAPDAATAQAYVYRYYLDGAATGSVATGVTCTGAAPITCEAPVPALTPGNHSIQLTASTTAGESAKSIPFPFVYDSVVAPAVPVNLRIK